MGIRWLVLLLACQIVSADGRLETTNGYRVPTVSGNPEEFGR